MQEGERLIEQFTRKYSILLPLMIITAVLLGWFMAGKSSYADRRGCADGAADHAGKIFACKFLPVEQTMNWTG